ncbi:MAG: hypothetical protein CBC22_04750 [Alphaproteobacteria bacterium TMED62]|nr:MAG: hypothetical protein CBC22_04750 [Alphaproteobacteria bacterium TMED62]|tara:strand:+ start:1227 stop:1439 length:213 start_codon:yes stop_codon:yes gene_type:complete
MLERLVRTFTRIITPTPPPKLGRWNTMDNIDIKSALANIDSCGDKLCGDVRATKAAIDKYQKPIEKKEEK